MTEFHLSDSGYDSGQPKDSEEENSTISNRKTDCFEYQRLDTSTDSFRLIKILQEKSPEGYIQLSLWHDNVSAGDYQCLSYQWGAATEKHTIHVNGKTFEVGANLHAFLEEKHARLQDASIKDSGGESLPLWIDSICIDQDFPEERGHQVQRMGSIYAGARDVLVWLGVHHTNEEFHSWVCSVLSSWGCCPQRLLGIWDDIRFNQYWKRAWIVQEILLSKSVKIIFRGKDLDWKTLGRAIVRSCNMDDYNDCKAAQLWSVWKDRWLNGAPRWQRLAKEDWMKHRRDHEEFWYLLYLHREAKCSDRRDRIYSILGMIHGCENFRVDYTESISDLFWRVGEHFTAWDASELVDVLRIALFDDDTEMNGRDLQDPLRKHVDPWYLIDSLKTKPDMRVRIPIRRAYPVTSLRCRVTGLIKCTFNDCRESPRLQCNHNDIFLCTNARADVPTEHGCIHGIAHPIDNPASERFEVNIVAHHKEQKTFKVLPSSALQFYDYGTDSWVDISTWSTLGRALERRDLDRVDHVKLNVPARYAIWIWFGVHPDQLHDVHSQHQNELPSAHHALPPGTKITRDSIELPHTQ